MNTSDLIAFTTAYFAGDAKADFNGDGVVTKKDALDYMNAFTAGCTPSN